MGDLMGEMEKEWLFRENKGGREKNNKIKTKHECDRTLKGKCTPTNTQFPLSILFPFSYHVIFSLAYAPSVILLMTR